MKTLLIVSHPELIDSGSQQYFLSSIKDFEDVTIHHLETTYPDWKIDVLREQTLLKDHDRVLFQFPFYWYSSPALLKHWQDMVLTEGFAFGKNGSLLSGKEFGLVMMIGVNEKEYQAGGSERFSINELTKPFQAMAHKTGMTYLKPLLIFQFGYLEEEQKMDLLIKYWQLLTMGNDHSLFSKEDWLICLLEKRLQKETDPQKAEIWKFVIEHIRENRIELDNLKVVLEQIRQTS